MSYRSKRTIAEVMTKESESTLNKKQTSPITTSLELPRNDIATARWGPFTPQANKAMNRQVKSAQMSSLSGVQNSNKNGQFESSLSLQPKSTPICKDKKSDILGHRKGHSALPENNKCHQSGGQRRDTDVKVPVQKSQANMSTIGSTIPEQPTKSTPIWKHPPPTSNLNTLTREKERILLKKPTLQNKSSMKATDCPPTLHNDRSSLSPSGRSLFKSNLESTTSLGKNTMSNNWTPSDTRPINEKVDPKVVKTYEAPQEKPSDHEIGEHDGSVRSKSFKPIRRNASVWPDNVEFDEKEEVMTIDAEGNYQMTSESIQPPDVWHSNGVKYFVSFNEFYQPLRKGGHILVRFIGDVAKTKRFCPIRETNWHHVNAQYKVDIVKLIQAHFVIPDGECYDQGILKRTGRSVRQYRHYLKKTFFKPTTKTKDQIYQAAPQGHPRDSWIHLVDYWYSEKGKNFSKCGKEARLSQNHVHTTGSKSYANIRADFEEKNTREPSLLEIFEQTHRKKDGTFVKDTITEDFLIDAEANVGTQMAFHPSSNMSRVEFENEAYSKLMYGDDVPKRPVGYGYGVKQSDVYGVQGMLRKEGLISGTKNTSSLRDMEKAVANLTEENKGLVRQNEELQIKCSENNCLLKKMTTQFGQILDVLSSGKAPLEFVDLAKTILDSTNSQVCLDFDSYRFRINETAVVRALQMTKQVPLFALVMKRINIILSDDFVLESIFIVFNNSVMDVVFEFVSF